MANRDEFDDPKTKGAIAGIFKAMDKREKLEKRGPVFTILPLSLMVIVLGGVLWYSYPKEAAKQDDAATPVIRADGSEYKVEPTDPGGMDIPYRESTVFDTLRSKNEAGDKQVENLLPESEAPMDRKELFAGLKTDVPSVTTPTGTETKPDLAVEDITTEPKAVVTPTPAPVVEDTTATPPAMPAQAVKVPEPAVKKEEIKAEETAAPAVDPALDPAAETAMTPPPVPESVMPVAPVPPAPAPVATAPVAPAPVVAPATGGSYVQLGSVKSRPDAEGLWKKLQAASPAQLGSLAVRIQEATIADKGTFYRIQGGPVDEAQAKSICQTLNAQKAGSCLVVKK